jgi:hypothetical protein
MSIRFVPALAAVLTCLTVPAAAQDANSPPALPQLEPAPLQDPASGGGWEGEWDGEWAPDGTYRGTWTGTYNQPEVPAPSGPDGVADAPLIRRVIPNSPFSFEQRNAWLAQCRSVFLQSGAGLGGGDGTPDACETQLAQYESNYVAPVAGAPYASSAGTMPVIWVRVPIVRERAVQPAAESGEAATK